MMKILEYDEVDSLSVLQLNMLALEFALTPEYALRLRQSDPRPFPFFALYAEEDGRAIGQVGVFRLPMISVEGREDVGGVWAVSTHPQHSGRGVASCLLEEAHARMREAGLRFSTLGTDRYRVAYELYRRNGYEDMQVQATALAPWETAHQPTRLHVRPPGTEGFDLVERLFENIAGSYLGFAWRHAPFARLRDNVSLDDVWILWENRRPVGYALAHSKKSILYISSLLLLDGVDVTEAVGAVAAELRSEYIRMNISRPSDIASLRNAGYHVAHPDWNAFMIKSLVPDVTVDDARRLFGVGTDRFLISWLDVT